MIKPREFDRNGKRLIPLTKELRRERGRQFRQAVSLYKEMDIARRLPKNGA